MKVYKHGKEIVINEKNYYEGKNCLVCGTTIGLYNKYCSKKCYEQKTLRS